MTFAEAVKSPELWLFLSLSYSSLAIILFTLHVFFGVRDLKASQNPPEWKPLGSSSIGTKEVIKAFLISLMILFFVTQAAYMWMPGATGKDAFECLSFAAPAIGSLLIGVGLVKEHEKTPNLLTIVGFKYYIISIIALFFGFVGFVGSHFVLSVFAWISLTACMLIFLFNWVKATETVPHSLSRLCHFSGTMFAGAATITNAAFWFTFFIE